MRGGSRSGRGPGAAALSGRRLAAAAHPIARSLDPSRSGVGPRDLLAALRRGGVALRGADQGYAALYSALNNQSGLFQRAARGRYVWLDPGDDDATV
ncbi:MAG: hypothetical protein H0W07_07310 [Chloroflexi bacterium]|nr:hypothetical protein [Chloroflexota bacterium]